MADDDLQQNNNTISTEESELARLREFANRFSPIADALDQDPSKYYAVRAAIEGRQEQQPAQQPGQPAPQQSLTPEQLAALNAQALSNPIETIAYLAGAIADQKLSQYGQANSPALEATAEGMIRDFKRDRRDDDKLYAKVAPIFERELKDLSRQALLQAKPHERERALRMRWNAAKAEVFEAAASNQRSDPQQLGNNQSGGGSGNPPPPKKQTRDQQMAQALAEQFKAKGLLSDEEIADLMKGDDDE